MSAVLNALQATSQDLSVDLNNLPSSAYSALVVSLEATVSNYQTLSNLAKSAECGAVLKADAYGIGAIPIALRLQRAGCRKFFVAYADEGVQLRQAFIQSGLEGEIIVLNGLIPGSEATFTDYSITPTLTDLDQISRWQTHSQLMGRKLPAAIHVDTGMSRTGLPSKELHILAETPQLLQGISIKLILSQMVYSHEENPTFSAYQRQRFESALRQLPKAPASLAKSGAIFLGPDYHYNVIRPGIGLHGINPTSNPKNPLTSTLSLWAKVYQVQDIAIGQTVGYAQNYEAKTPKKIATLTVGYADGYPWALANKGYVYFGPYKAPLIGRVSMDLLTIDVTDIPETLVYNGAWAQLIGGDLTIEEIAKAAGTVPYEILLGLGKRFQRIYTE